MKLKLFLMGVSAAFLLWVMASVVLAQEELPPPYVGLKNPFSWDDPAVQEKGGELYQQSCQVCHGAGGRLSGADFSATDFPRRLEESPGLYFWILSEGRLDKGMPAYKSSMSEEQRWQILTYLWSLGRGGAVSVAPLPVLVGPAPEDAVLPDCFRCHTRALKGHDKLGTGSAACLVCHSNTHMGVLRLFDNTEIFMEDSPQLCGQCHQPRYRAWQEGNHGIVARMRGDTTATATAKPKCPDCHDPHQPRLSLTIASTIPSPTSGKEGRLDCLSCHVRVLKAHDKLGEGSGACWACHLSTEMTTLHLAGEQTKLPLAASVKLCAQCHQERYQDWEAGTHGVPAWKEGEPAIIGSEKVKCVNCHDPHQPQIALLDITKPHPEPAPSPPPPPTNILVVLGIALLAMIGIGVAVSRGGGAV